MLISVGRVCVKKFGRDAGSRAVITAVEKGGFVKVKSASRQKERRCNPAHLEYLNEVIDLKNEEQLNKALRIEAKKAPARASKKAAA